MNVISKIDGAYQSTWTAIARSAQRLCPVRARCLCRDTKERGAVERRPERPRPAAAAAPGRPAAGARPVVRRSHVGPGACAPSLYAPRAGCSSIAVLDPITCFCCKYITYMSSFY